jgi:septal ring factor EnvC (AmiA/AmiB activator)
MPKTTRMEPKQLPVADRVARIRPIVEALSNGDPDKEDLIRIFDEYERVAEEIRQTQGALRVARYALKVALQTIQRQKQALDVLSIGND